jgi:hypothetical protein
MAHFDLNIDIPDGAILREIEMGGGGEAGNSLPVPGDLDGNRCVDDSDLLAVLFAFGSTGEGLDEDLTGDGVVDDVDLLIVLFNFGTGC